MDEWMGLLPTCLSYAQISYWNRASLVTSPELITSAMTLFSNKVAF